MRIGSGLSSVDWTGISNLTKITNRIASITQQLATGLMLNRGSDNPAATIASSQISNELAAIEGASRNASYASDMINVADAGMAQVGKLLDSIKSNVVKAADGMLTSDQKQAIQVDIDAAVQAVNTISQTTMMGGKKLLDGQTFTFNFSTDVSNTVSLAMPNINTAVLGGSAGSLNDLTSGGSANVVSGDLTKADAIVNSATVQVAQDRARLGSFDRYTVESSQSLLGAMQVSLSSALSQVQDTDYAPSISSLVRDEILAKATMQTLVIANRSRNMVLQLLTDTGNSH